MHIPAWWVSMGKKIIAMKKWSLWLAIWLDIPLLCTLSTSSCWTMALNVSLFMVLFFDQVVTYSFVRGNRGGNKGRKGKRIYQVSPPPHEKKKKLLQVSNHNKFSFWRFICCIGRWSWYRKSFYVRFNMVNLGRLMKM